MEELGCPEGALVSLVLGLTLEEGVEEHCYCPLELTGLEAVGLGSLLEWPYWGLPLGLLGLLLWLLYLYLMVCFQTLFSKLYQKHQFTLHVYLWYITLLLVP